MTMKWSSVFSSFRIIKVALLLLLVSCTGSKMEPYVYGQEFEAYLEAIDAKLDFEKVILLPLDSCGLCVEQVLEDLQKSNQGFSVIFSGEKNSPDRVEKAKKLFQKENLQIIIDENSKSKSFDLNAFSPIILDVSKKEYSYASLSPQNSPEYILD
ncbi:hypothetical protein [Algoriphagus hitonicola]|uniref:Uncharacterized protein n=1 Tax=Algoriphagus hitonicola TaxID=435880 RepID=A0A1I2T8X3_9BACT|nr:hypothetical protein [Algoriphagus hitonicola]SFG58781.1 hypothetical protein SAMN04487988_105172 [Algoriphagus hitonicola]